MKRLSGLLPLAVAAIIGLCGWLSNAEAKSQAVVIRRITTGAGGGGGGGGGPAFEFVGGNISSTTVASGTMTFTCTSNTKTLLVALGFRRNSSQTVNAITWNGQALTLSTQTGSGLQLYSGLWYLQNPGAGSGNIVVTLSASSPGFGFTAISFTGATAAPINEGKSATQAVTSSTASATTSQGDILVDFQVKQDTTTVQPTLTSSTASSQKRWANSGSSAGNTFWADLNISTAGLTSPTQTNLSWVGSANHCHTWTVVH